MYADDVSLTFESNTTNVYDNIITYKFTVFETNESVSGLQQEQLTCKS